MAQNGVVGTAVGLDQKGGQAILILLEKPGVPDIPKSLEGVPVQTVVTGKIYARRRQPLPVGRPTPGGTTTTAPAAPSDLTAEAISSSQIKLVWADHASNETGFQIERKTGTGVFRQIGTVGANKTSGSDVGLAASTAYTYRVRAYNKSGSSAYSNETPVTTKPSRWYPRPVPIGVSTGNAEEDSAGTIACRLVDESGTVYVLSNNHVYARENLAHLGEPVVQPGVFDQAGKYNSACDIGALYAFIPIDFATSTNTVDAAIATILTDNGVPRVGFATPSNGYGAPNSTIRLLTEADIGLGVQKYGRTTALTKGTVTGTNATLDVVYSDGTARFVNQIIVQSRSAFIKAGDSGSLLVTNDRYKNPVGLLFAGNSPGTYAVANHIEDVLEAFADLGLTVEIDNGQ
jgi:hypothetical protein